jgi:hypothetical protein
MMSSSLKGLRFTLAMALTGPVAILALGASRPAEAAAPTCRKLEQNCEAYAAKMADALAHTQPEQVGRQNVAAVSVQQCKAQYASAALTGLWPARGAVPPLPCGR